VNAFLLSLGIAIALILAAAFTAPFFIDWSSYRTYFEAQASEALGRPVAIDGAFDVRIMPYPSLIADDVRIGADGSQEGVERIELRAALTPLLSGRFQVTDFTLIEPRAVLRLAADGAVSWAADDKPVMPVDPDRITLDKIDITAGHFTIEDARSGETYLLEGVNLTGSATSLRGPFKVEGGGSLDGDRYTVKLATGRMADDGSGMRVKASILPAATALDIDLDGALLRIDNMPVFDGRLVVKRPGPEPETEAWRLDGALVASPEALVMDQLSVRLGTEERHVSLSGAANVRFGADPRFDAVISARQIDFDRSFGSGPDAPVSTQAAVGTFGSLLDPAIFPLPGHLALDVESLVVAGGLLERLTVDVEIDGDIWAIERAVVAAPGRSNLGIAGTIGFGGADPVFDGAMRLDSEQAGVFANWLFATQADATRFGVPVGRMEASAQVRLDAAGMAFERVDIRTPDSEVQGSARYAPAGEGRRGEVALALTADSFDLPDLGPGGLAGEAGLLPALEALLSDVDLGLQLQAGALSSGDISANGVQIDVLLSDGDARVRQLSIEDLGGARLSGSGAVEAYASAPDGDLDFGLSADALDGVIDVLRTLGADRTVDLLADRASALVPVDLTVALTAAGSERGSAGSIDLGGTAGASDLSVAIGFDGDPEAIEAADLDIRASGYNPDGGLLARQLGLVSPMGLGSGVAGEVSLTARGRLDDDMDLALRASGIGIDGEIRGNGRWSAADGVQAGGSVSADIADFEALLGLAGIVLPSIDATPVAVKATIAAADGVWELDGLEITDPLAGMVGARGSLSFDLSGEDRVIGGALDADRLSLEWLAGALVGTPAVVFPQAPDGETAFPSAPLAPVERVGWRGRIGLTARTFDLTDTVSLGDAQADFSFDPTRLSLENLRGNAYGGRMVAGVDLTTEDGFIELTGRLDLNDARLEEIIWQANGRPVATGAVWAGAEFTGQGRSLSGIAATLTGTGTFRAVDGVLRRFNPIAFDQIVSAADAGLDLTEDKVGTAFAGHLDSGSLRFEAMDGAFSIASGVVRASNIRIDTDALDSFASATIDLPELQLSSEWTLQVTDDEEASRTREVAVVFSGPLDQPQRRIDVSPLLGYLTVRAFEQEVERLENLQAEILERQRLGRELIRQGQERVRREREEAERAEDEAARLEAEREAAEEAARRREEEAAERLRQEEAEQARLREAERQAAEEARQREQQLREQYWQDQQRLEQQRLEEERAAEQAGLSPTDPLAGSGVGAGPATRLDSDAFRRRIEDLLQEIPATPDEPLPTGGVLAREPLPSAGAAGTTFGEPAPRLNAPVIIVPRPSRPVAPAPRLDNDPVGGAAGTRRERSFR